MDQTCRINTMNTVNMLHYTFAENTFGYMSQAPCYFKTVPSVCAGKIKAVWCIGSNSWGVKLCQWSKGNHQRLFSARSTAGWRDRRGLIVYQTEAEDSRFVRYFSLYSLLPAFPPKWRTLTRQRELKSSRKKKPWDKQHECTEILDEPPKTQPVTLTFSIPAGTSSCKKTYIKVGFKKRRQRTRERALKMTPRLCWNE